jgi:dipeptidyl aminopeptidase/acylaminoacyl peptidase
MKTDEFLEALLSLPALEEPRVSRDGKWVAWTWYRAGPAADVYAAPTDGSAAPIRLTETPHDSLVVSWTPDSRSVLVSQDQDGDERAQLFRVDLDQPLGATGGQPDVMQPLTEPSPNFHLRGGQLHPNGRWLIYGANLDAATGQEIEPTWVYRHDLETGERVALARPQRGCDYIPELNDPGTHVLYSRGDLHPAGRQVWLADVEGREDREILNVGADRKALASWFPDGRRALVLAETETHQRVGVWDLQSGETRWLLDDPARNVEAAYVPHGCDWAVIVEAKDARAHASLLDVETGEQVYLPRIPGTLVPLAPVGGGEWVGEYCSSHQPADLVRFPLAEVRPDSFVSLTRVWERTPLSAEDLAPAEDFRWRSVDGLEIQGWLYRPRGKASPRATSGASPRAASGAGGTVVYVHGGPTWHSQDRINAQIQFFVSQGFTVLDPNYRGSTGFGLAYREAIKEDGWGGREQEDIRAGIEALLAAGIAEPGRVGITGTSYGGYSAWWAITHFPPEVVAAAAPICGMTDLVVDYQTTRPDLRTLSEEMMGGSPEQIPERYRERSPLYFVDKIQGRLLIVQGLRDPNVTSENVRVVRDALEQAGVEYELLTFEDEGHGIARPKNHRILYARLAQFFEESFHRSWPV